tara:strand:+ start:845 stop:1489 length:645 start_codon:yes stop_codon:yes gene_type:complete
MIKDIAEYIDINPDMDLIKSLFDEVNSNDFNSFGKTQWISYSLEDRATGKDLKNLEIYEPLLSEHRKVHPNIKKRDTGFNVSDSTKKDLYAHADIDFHLEYPNYYNIVIPVFGRSVIEYFETKREEIFLPEKDAHGHWYYWEFKNRNKPGYEEFLQERKIGEIEVFDKPVFIDTNTMHRVIVTEAPRCAWVTRWNNVPKEYDYQTFKKKVESIL